MPQTYVTKAIVLKRRPYRSSDSSVTLYSRDKGKLGLVIRGGLKPGSKMSAHSEQFNLAEVMVIEGRVDYAGAMVSQACFPDLKADYDKLSAAGYAFGRFNRLIKEQVIDEELFDLAVDFLSVLNRVISDPLWYEWLSVVFVLKISRRLGYGLDLSRCRQCGREPADVARLVLSEGRLVCDQCGLEAPGEHVILNPTERRYIIEAESLALTKLNQISLTRSDIDSVNRSLKRWFDYIFE